MIRTTAFSFIIVLLALCFTSCATSKELDHECKKLSRKCFRQLWSLNEEKRSTAAYELYKMGHPKALDACIKTIDDSPDELHYDHSSSTSCLMNLGEISLLPVVELLLSKNEMTRIRALNVIAGILYRTFEDPDAENDHVNVVKFGEWWDEIGFDAEASLEDRKVSIENFKVWFANRDL